jgi:hypothetical protein
VGTPLSEFTGAWFALFGAGVLVWCAGEVRARRRLRRSGVPGMARVLPDPDAAADHADTSPVLGYTVEGHGEVVARPRGWTTIRRTGGLAVDTLVPVSYDPARPGLVAVEGTGQSRSDVFWLLLGLAFVGCGAALLGGAF